MTDLHTLAGAYALDAVDDLDRARFEQHLAACPACATEVAELIETVATFAEATGEAPPTGLRAAVLARVDATPQLRRPKAGRRMPRRRWLAAAAAVVALGGAGAVGYTIADRSGSGTGGAQRIAAVLDAPDARAQSAAAGGGRVTVVASGSLDEAVAVLTDLPAPGAGRAYQLWVIRDRVPHSVGVLAAGRTKATELIRGVHGAQTLGVSREPAGGSRTPTVPLVAQVPLG